jgi:hypothetical protein
MMIEQPGQLFHLDIIGPSWVCSMGSKWYVLVIVDDTLITLRFSSWNNEHPNYLKAIHSDNETVFRNANFNQFCLEHGID